MSKNIIKKLVYNDEEYEIKENQGGGYNIISLTQEEYDALETKDPNAVYSITDAQDIDVYSKRETYSKTEADNKFSLKGEGKTYTGASGVTVNNNTNVISVNAVSGLSRTSVSDYVMLTYTKAGEGVSNSFALMRKLKVNGVNQTLDSNSLLDLDAVYAKKTDIPTVPTFKTINGNEITGEGNIVIGDGGGSFDTNDYYTKTEINDMIGTLNNALNAI